MKTKRCSNNHPDSHGWHAHLIPRFDLGVDVDTGKDMTTQVSVPAEKVLCVGVCYCTYPNTCEYGPYAHWPDEKVPTELNWK